MTATPTDLDTQSPSQPGSDWLFHYRGCEFQCGVTQTTSGDWLAHVLYRSGVPGMEQGELALDAAPYASAAEAKRHAEQHAVRWTHDQSGDGQGRS